MILKYFFAWFGMMVLAIINGGLRDFAYHRMSATSRPTRSPPLFSLSSSQVTSGSS
jgi:hypothetical protein